MDAEARLTVRELIADFMDRWLDDAVPAGELERIRREGVSPSGLLAPMHDALVPGITLLRERSFSTRLGNLHERVAEVVGRAAHAEAKRAYDLAGTMPALAREFITQRLRTLESGEAQPSVPEERQALLNSFGQAVADETRIDLRIVTASGEEHFFEMKSAKPNKGQCIEMKQRLMKAVALRGSDSAWAWWGVPYNPYGTAEYAHPYPRRFFDFRGEVKMGPDFWNFIGSDDNTYDELLAVYRDVGSAYSQKLRELLSQSP